MDSEEMDDHYNSYSQNYKRRYTTKAMMVNRDKVLEKSKRVS